MRAWLGRLLLKLLRWLRPAEGWAVLLSLGGVLLALAEAFNTPRWLPAGQSANTPVLLGLLFGLLAIRKLRSDKVIWGLALLLGVAFTVLTTIIQVRHLQNWPALMQDLQDFAQLAQENSGPLPRQLIAAASFFILWMSAVWASWATFRRHHALLALSLPGLLLGGTMFFAVSGYFWGAFFIFSGIMLALSLNYAQTQQDWERRRVAYSPEVALETYLYGLMMALFIALAALALPSIRLSPITDAFWRVWAEPYAALEARIAPRFKTLRQPPRELIGGGKASATTLPRAHLLGGRPELSERVIMTVWVDDPHPAAPEFWSDYRWRGPTFARYTGRGWQNPPALSGDHLGPGETWLTVLPADRRPLRQIFRFKEETPYWLYAAGEPVAADISARAFLLGPDNLLGMTAGVRRYEVLSQSPTFEAEHLRVAPDDYPPALLPYLALPDSVSPHTRKLAQNVAAEADNAYDQALALQAHLRSYSYTLDIEEPPAGVDVVDYFLFELKKGYCDYSASAMVVMARSLGIPARLAVGYAPGDYDAAKNQLIVRERDGHSWPELYFPGYGWIPFEPTPDRPVFQPQPRLSKPREDNKLDIQDALQALRRQGRWQQVQRWASWFVAALLLILLGRAVWREWRLRRRAANGWQRAWLRLERAGARVGVTPAPWLTPQELVGRWQQMLQRRYPGHPAAPALLDEITALARNLEARAYARPAQHPPEAAAGVHWRKIWWLLRRLTWPRRHR